MNSPRHLLYVNMIFWCNNDTEMTQQTGIATKKIYFTHGNCIKRWNICLRHTQNSNAQLTLYTCKHSSYIVREEWFTRVQRHCVRLKTKRVKTDNSLHGPYKCCAHNSLQYWSAAVHSVALSVINLHRFHTDADLATKPSSCFSLSQTTTNPIVVLVWYSGLCTPYDVPYPTMQCA